MLVGDDHTPTAIPQWHIFLGLQTSSPTVSRFVNSAAVGLMVYKFKGYCLEI